MYITCITISIIVSLSYFGTSGKMMQTQTIILAFIGAGGEEHWRNGKDGPEASSSSLSEAHSSFAKTDTTNLYYSWQFNSVKDRRSEIHI